MKKYKVTTCLNPLSTFVESQIQQEAINGWKFASHSCYKDESSGFWNVTLVYFKESNNS